MLANDSFLKGSAPEEKYNCLKWNFERKNIVEILMDRELSIQPKVDNKDYITTINISKVGHLLVYPFNNRGLRQ